MVTFFNPGNLFGNNIELKDLKDDSYASQTRNKLIAEAFYLTKDIEKYGSGFIRIRQEIKEYPTMQFNYLELGNGFLAELNYTEQIKQLKPTLINKKNIAKVGDKVGDNLNSSQIKILHLIKVNAFISGKELADLIGISKRKIEENIKKLKDVNKLKRVGSTKSGHWEIVVYTK